MTDTTLDYVNLAFGLGGGLAIFLYGMRKMTDALKLVAGTQLKNLLARLTTNAFTGAISGALITAVIQSSSVTSVMVVGFVSARLMTFTQSVGVIMGANVGTTITAQIVAFKITQYALVMIASGFLIEVLAKSRRLQQYGIALMGLGLLFFGMDLMSQAAVPLRNFEPFIDIMRDLKSPLIGVIVGFGFTAIVQSSSATTGIVIVLASQGFIPLETGIALIFGANIGTCVTASLSAIGKPREAVKSAVVHIIFNVMGVLLWIAFIPYFADAVRSFSPTAPELHGTAQLAVEVPRQIANAHTIFNVANTLIFIGFASGLGRLVERLVPRPKASPLREGQTRYIDAIYLTQPSVALDQVKLEISHLSNLSMGMLKASLPATLSGMDKDLNTLRDRDDEVDNLHGEIITYLGKLSAQTLVEPQPERIHEYISIANYLESAGDVVENGFVLEGYKRLEAGLKLHDKTIHELSDLHTFAIKTFEHAIKAFEKRDISLAQKVVESKNEFNKMADETRIELNKQLSRDAKRHLPEYRFASEHIEGVKRFHSLACRIARMFLDFQDEAKRYNKQS